MKPSIVTVSSGKPEQPYYTYDQFFTSCARFGYEPIVLGSNPGEYGGLGSKLRLLKRAIEDGTVPEGPMIFCDCYDVVMQRDPAGYFALGTMFVDIEYGGERNCFPNARLAKAHPITESPYRYLNTGVGAGSTDGFLRMLNRVHAGAILNDYQDEISGAHITPNDQEIVMAHFIMGGDILVDTNCELVLNLQDVPKEEIAFDSKKCVCPIGYRGFYGLGPCFIHFNGGSKTSGLREPILEHLGL